MSKKMRTQISLICLIYSWHFGAEAFTTWTRTGEVRKETAPLESDATLPTSKKKIKYYRQRGNFLDKDKITKLVDIRASYFDIQRKCMSEGMSVFLPSNQAEIDEVHDLIPSTLRREDDGEIIEDIYSGLYIRMSDMDYEGCWKTDGTNGALRPFSQMEDQYKLSCPIQNFPHITSNMVLDDGYDRQSGEDFMILTLKDKKFYDVSHMMTILDGGFSSVFLDIPTNSDWLDEEFETPGTNAFHGLLAVCEYPEDDDGNPIVPCDEANYANDFCVGHQKDIKYVPGTFSYDDAETECSNLGADWQLWYPESEEEEADTLAALKSAEIENPTHWVRDAGTFQCRYNRKMKDPKNGVDATHYTTPGDYTLQDGASGSHNVICEKVMDQYKEEREICESTRSLDVTDNIPIANDDGVERNLEYVGMTTYRRAHAICQAKGQQLFLPRDRTEIHDVYNIFYRTIIADGSTIGNPREPSVSYFEGTDYTELNLRPSAWIRYTDQDEEHCWLSDDQCYGGMKWTSWAYRWAHRTTVGYFPKGEIHQDTEVDCTLDFYERCNRFWTSNVTFWLHQPDNWGTTRDKLVAYAKRFNEYGQQYAAIDAVSKAYQWRQEGYPDHGDREYYANMHDTYNLYPRGFAFCEDESTNCETMNIVEDSTCLSRSMVSSSLEVLSGQMTYADAKAACAAKDMIIWQPDNLVEQNEAAKALQAKGLLAAGDEVWLRLTFEEGNQPGCGDTTCTDNYCCCADNEKCKMHELEAFLNKPGESDVGTWKIDWKNTNSLNPTDPGPMHMGFTHYSTMDPKAWDTAEYWNMEKPPSCHLEAPYYHWATDEPKNFKAVGKYHRNPREDEKSLYAVYSHSHSGIAPGTSKDVNGDWVSKAADDTAIVLCQTRDFWRHYMLKRCEFGDD